MSARKDTDKAIVTNSEAVSVKFDKSQLDSSISAIVKIAGQQHMAYKGLKIECQKIHAEVGQELIFNDVLALFTPNKAEFGKALAGKQVVAKVVEHYRDKKIIIYKKIRRHGYQRKAGHRQNVTVLEVIKVQ